MIFWRLEGVRFHRPVDKSDFNSADQSIMALRTTNDTDPPLNLDTLPIDIVSSYLDLEDALSLTIVNRFFHAFLTTYNALWTRFLEQTLGAPARGRTEMYKAVLHTLPFHRCVECKCIYGLVVPVHYVFGIRICHQCAVDNPKFELISGYEALTKYRILTPADYEPLRCVRSTRTMCIRKPSPHGMEGLMMRRNEYSLHEVKGLAAQKKNAQKEKNIKGRKEGESAAGT